MKCKEDVLYDDDEFSVRVTAKNGSLDIFCRYEPEVCHGQDISCDGESWPDTPQNRDMLVLLARKLSYDRRHRNQPIDAQ